MSAVRQRAEGTFEHLPGNRQIGVLPWSAQHRALGNPGTPIGRQFYAAWRHGDLSDGRKRSLTEDEKQDLTDL